MKLSFENTETAFTAKSDADLSRAYLLFRMVSSNSLVKAGKILTNIAVNLHLPVKGMIKATIFKQFCGGENITECNTVIDQLGKFGIGTILDYSLEGKQNEKDFDATEKEIIQTIISAKGNEYIPFSVFKVTGIARFTLLEKVNSGISLNDAENAEWERARNRVNSICKSAFENDVPVFIDAEESWIQDAIDQLALEMMRLYNRKKAIIYNTLQLYRTGRLIYFTNLLETAKNEGFKVGMKLVRGAYMEKERSRALELKYISPIQKDKLSADKEYDAALEFSVRNIDTIAICAGTHNEASSLYLTQLLEQFVIQKNHPNIYFAQLLGMSDHISYNLAKAGYNVAKYVPYGPVREVLPYLIRRAEENTSVAGQTSRELSLILKERERRKKAR
jgi:proline dehydrogenase